jgi:hypothetical protein
MKLNHHHRTTTAENIIIKHQLKDITEVIEAMKERKMRKRMIIEVHVVIRKPEIYKKLVAHEKELAEKKQKEFRKRKMIK